MSVMVYIYIINKEIKTWRIQHPEKPTETESR